MKTKEILSYVLGALGLISIGLSYSTLRSLINIPLSEKIAITEKISFSSETALMVIGIILLLCGAYLLFKNKKENQHHEVPIYHGEKIVGYRRMHHG